MQIHAKLTVCGLRIFQAMLPNVHSFLLQRSFIPTIICFVAGAVASFSMAPYHLIPFLFVGMSVLYYGLYSAQSVRQAVLRGFLFGFGYFLFGLEWIGNALLVEGNDFAWVRPLAICGLPTVLALFYVLPSYLARRFFALDKLSGFFALCASFALADWLRGHLFTGFPWNFFAHAWGESLEVLQLLSLSNVYYLNLLSIVWAFFPAFLFLSSYGRRFKIIAMSFALLSLALPYAYGTNILAKNETAYVENEYVHIVQPNILQHEKWKREYIQRNFDRLLEMSEPDIELSAEDNLLVAWPETAMGDFVLDAHDNKEKLAFSLSQNKANTHLLSGMLRGDSQVGYRNTASLLNKDAEIVEEYSKTKLVPFGEFIPFQEWIPLRPVANFQGFIRGEGVKIQKIPQSLSYVALICYEVIFPFQSIDYKDKHDDLIVNVTNDGWYGVSAGPYQHLLHARFRAIENGAPLVRVANTGVSALFDSYGRVLYKSDIYEKKSRTLPVPKAIKQKKTELIIQNFVFLFVIFGFMFTPIYLGLYFRSY